MYHFSKIQHVTQCRNYTHAQALPTGNFRKSFSNIVGRWTFGFHVFITQCILTTVITLHWHVRGTGWTVVNYTGHAFGTSGGFLPPLTFTLCFFHAPLVEDPGTISKLRYCCHTELRILRTYIQLLFRTLGIFADIANIWWVSRLRHCADWSRYCFSS